MTTELFKPEPEGQNLTTYAIARAAGDPTVQTESERLTQLLAQVPRVEVTDQASNEKATDLIKLIKTSRKKLDDVRKELTGPVDRALKAVNKYFRETAFQEADAAEKDIKGKIAAWYTIERQRREEEARRRAEAEEAKRLELAEAAEAQGLDAAADAILEGGIENAEAEMKAAKMGTTRGQHGGTSSARTVWKWRLTDKDQVPREYLTVDNVLVNEAVRNGVRELPGIEIYEDVQIAIR